MSSRPLTSYFGVKRKAPDTKTDEEHEDITVTSKDSESAQEEQEHDTLSLTPKAEAKGAETTASSVNTSKGQENDGGWFKRSRTEPFTVAKDLSLSNLEDGSMDPSWRKALMAEFKKPYFIKLKAFLAKELQGQHKIFPPLVDVYSWSRFTPFREVRVVILGQDPYHNYNQAHGLCFSVRRGIPPPPSLMNMYKELTLEYPSFTPPKHGYLGGWASQGVLMLNATLTVRAHQAASHANQGWENLTDAAVDLVNKRKNHVVFMLWGSHAQKKGRGIDKKKHLVLQAPHPSPLSAHRGFFNCGHFEKANAFLKSKGLPPVDWTNLPEDIAQP
ncbi:MAG: uracil-DNA glycosylase-like protein [Piptocephalis tieghemiana]|nr:MAG: uracil-DNA glycosylase-like protein [Piptocephalis tieghemiana]